MTEQIKSSGHRLAGLVAMLLMLACGNRNETEDEKAGDLSKQSPSLPAPKTSAGAAQTACARYDEPEPAPAATGTAPPPQVKRPSPKSRPLLENPFVDTATDEKSTFGVDVDTASYTMVRSFIKAGMMPPPGRIRIEEMLNYFRYSYPAPPTSAFGFMTDAAEAPWALERRLVRIGIKGREIAAAARPRSNLVFLIDVSGSMLGPNKLGLLKQGFAMMIDKLDERDTVSIVTYAGRSGIALPPTAGNRRAVILTALESLEPAGGTNGSQGIQSAYRIAAESFIPGGTNRVLVATDGDFNMGMTSPSALQLLIERMAGTGIYLTMLGFGQGNPQDKTMELLADHGNGNYAFIDSAAEARRFLSRELTGTLVTIAKDVKLQVAWNPRTVKSFRLIGYENRQLEEDDFADDTKDAGDIGSGHTVTALYDIEPVSQRSTGETFGKVSIRFKAPDGSTSQLVEGELPAGAQPMEEMTTDFRFATAVAAFGMVLRGSKHVGNLTLQEVETLAAGALGDDPEGERSELVALVKKARLRRASLAAAAPPSVGKRYDQPPASRTPVSRPPAPRPQKSKPQKELSF